MQNKRLMLGNKEIAAQIRRAEVELFGQMSCLLLNCVILPAIFCQDCSLTCLVLLIVCQSMQPRKWLPKHGTNFNNGRDMGGVNKLCGMAGCLKKFQRALSLVYFEAITFRF